MKTIKHSFCKTIPEVIKEGILYISLDYGTVVHKCCCGCGSEIVTPLGPNDWKVIFDGETVSLYPSIGNWSYECRSHYWITNSKVYWAEKWSDERIEENRQYDQKIKEKYYKQKRKKSCKGFFR